MSIEDRDYMSGQGKPSKDDDVIDLLEILRVVAISGAVLLALFLCLRFPLIWVKIPLAIVILLFGWRLIFRSKKKRAVKKTLSGTVRGRDRHRYSKVEVGTKAGAPATVALPKPGRDAVKLLISFDAAGKFGRAKVLIEHFDGEVFPGSSGNEFAAVAKNYYPVELETAEGGSRFKLA